MNIRERIRRYFLFFEKIKNNLNLKKKLIFWIPQSNQRKKLKGRIYPVGENNIKFLKKFWKKKAKEEKIIKENVQNFDSYFKLNRNSQLFLNKYRKIRKIIVKIIKMLPIIK